MLLAVVAVAAVIVAAVIGGRLLGGDDDTSADPTSGGASGSTAAGDERPERLLVSPVALTWPSRTVADCASYEPAAEPEVVYLPTFSYACVHKVPEESSVVFSAPAADELGGIGWAKGSRPWVEIDGRQVMEKREGDEFNLSARVIQGVWTADPQEFAVYVGPESPDALAELSALGTP